MNNVKDITLKFTGIYRGNWNINDLKIRVKIREYGTAGQEGPKTDLEEIKTFKWQEKVFGKFEKQLYQDKKNCVTDLEKSYHDIVSNLMDDNNLLYSYTKNDSFYCPKETPTIFTNKIKPLLTRMQSSSIVEPVKTSQEFNYNERLLDAIKNPCMQNCLEHIFYIMADFGDYVDNTLLKFEYTVCAIKYNESRNILTVYPDFTEMVPYIIQVNSDASKLYEIYIDNLTEDMSSRNLDKDCSVSNNLQLSSIKFELPPKKTQLIVHIYGEILKGSKFEHDFVYVTYLIDPNVNWTCTNLQTLTGDTYTCQTNHHSTANFSHHFYCQLDYNDTSENKSDIDNKSASRLCSAYLYLEATGLLSWQRFRSEGLGYIALPIYKPGKFEFDVQCCRLLPQNSWERMRRHFVGDYRNYEDVTWFVIPKENEGRILNKFGPSTVASCNIRVRLNIIHECSDYVSAGADRGPMGDDTVKGRARQIAMMDRLQSCSSATRDLDQVLEDFQRAKRKMLEVRRNI